MIEVENLSFKVREGAITGFLGPNGAGKTTTLRVILGLVRPTAGRATVMQRPYRELGARRRGLGVRTDREAFRHLMEAPAGPGRGIQHVIRCG